MTPPATSKARDDGEDSYRFERKFLALGLTLAQTESCILRNPGCFSPIFHERVINNIYLDSPSLQFYADNVNGASDRQKFRIRWYGPLLGPVAKPVLEIKTKHALLGGKHSFPLKPFTLTEGFCFSDLRASWEGAALPGNVRHAMESLQPAMINRYHRRYFLSRDGIYRSTLDFDLSFTEIVPRGNMFRHRRQADGLHVVELKYANGNEERADQIARRFPFRLNRISKYVLGLNMLYGHG